MYRRVARRPPGCAGGPLTRGPCQSAAGSLIRTSGRVKSPASRLRISDPSMPKSRAAASFASTYRPLASETRRAVEGSSITIWTIARAHSPITEHVDRVHRSQPGKAALELHSCCWIDETQALADGSDQSVGSDITNVLDDLAHTLGQDSIARREGVDRNAVSGSTHQAVAPRPTAVACRNPDADDTTRPMGAGRVLGLSPAPNGGGVNVPV